jgi:2-polyprenyl-3-methyl-5-hydroxy-6-metoxy-1,4-benzoquinol methylase
MIFNAFNLIINRLLGVASIYDLFQVAIGGYTARRQTIVDAVGSRSSLSVLDLGCGTGIASQWLNCKHYTGIDLDPGYLDRAKSLNSKDCLFVLGCAQDVSTLVRDRKFDIILMIGILHHLKFEDCAPLLHDVAGLLNDGGQLIGMEPSFFVGQSWLTRTITQMDRGKNILHQEEWEQLLSECFPHTDVRVTSNLMRIPYGLFIYTASMKN